MGYYINPKDMSKEQWLEKNGVKLQYAPKYDDTGKTKNVCLVFNSYFTAAGIAYSEEEQDVFASPDDFCLRDWYCVDTEKLLEVTPELRFVL